ncbi:GNAT superfamily N-acetyltransferase [Caulobacter ginsengisoli]|uniref:GNAT superfamily N-acetyltransferase n=1 Tax=Caulobacter ginsengisoli TaxID=400775 RepID=A0ABU0IQG4_9CAUL|nr:GNAT family N-acetyltransferase [Caulobacter ginsengisoli]MDQ0464257.1 GNAT superfamily N-acetyltransferase [Caulobacter ginsengisoli]
MPQGFSHRLATIADVPALTALSEAAIDALLGAVLSPAEVASSRLMMGIDSQLIADGTYFVVEKDGQIAGCGGWSRRATHYGGDHSPGRDDALLDPATDAARVRAMYTHPAFARQGVGRLVLELCEAAAAEAGFHRLELTATAAGEPLYAAYGFTPERRFTDARGGAPVPLCVMSKPVA